MIKKLLRDKKAKGPSLLFIILGLGVFLTIIVLSFNMYNGFMTSNGQTIDPTYAAYYNNLSSQRSGLDTLNTNLNAATIASIPQAVGSTLMSVLNIGLGAIRGLITIATLLPQAFTILSEGLHLPEPLIWLVTFIIGVYIAIKLVQALRGSIIEP